MSNIRHHQESRTLVDHVLARLTAIYGAQKMASTWAAQSDDEVAEMHATWDEAMRPYSSETIGRALRNCMDEGPAWPPTLPQFMAMVRQADAELLAERPAKVLRLGDDSSLAPADSEAVEKFRKEVGALLRAKKLTAARPNVPVRREPKPEPDRPADEGYGGLPALLAVCAKAAAAAGEDEAATMARLERDVLADPAVDYVQRVREACPELQALEGQ